MNLTLNDVIRSVLAEELPKDQIVTELQKLERPIRAALEKGWTPTQLAKRLKKEIDKMDDAHTATEPSYKPIKASEERIRTAIQRICGIATPARSRTRKAKPQ